MTLLVYETPEEIAAAAARDFAARAKSAVEERGRFTVALAGGSTPRATYEVLASEYAGALEWGAVHVFFGDERAVPPESEESNYRMAREALLDHVPLGSVHRMHGELLPERAAASYEEDLRGFFGAEGVPSFDLVLCGLGEDGHTLSLFPETAALDVSDRLVVANPVLKLETTRLTLTVPVVNAARAATFLVAGEGKAAALKEVLEGNAPPSAYPARFVSPRSGDLTWRADRAAAGLLGFA